MNDPRDLDDSDWELLRGGIKAEILMSSVSDVSAISATLNALVFHLKNEHGMSVEEAKRRIAQSLNAFK
jgi:hypothetical protein